VIATTGFVVLRSQKRDAAQSVLAALANESEHRNTIAVMFLENQSKTPELDWLREGLVDMLVTGLSRSKTLSVVGRQQVALLLDRVGVDRLKPIELPQAVELARRARLDHFVLGTFAKLGGTIRIDLRLHDGGGRLVTSEALTIDQPDDLLRQVDVLGWRLAQHFGELESTTSASAALTTNLDAYRYYSLGVTKANSFHSLEAIDLFTRATELDPQFAMAFARIGYVYGVTGEHVDRARPFPGEGLQHQQPSERKGPAAGRSVERARPARLPGGDQLICAARSGLSDRGRSVFTTRTPAGGRA
jgi:TolB-like protein